MSLKYAFFAFALFISIPTRSQSINGTQGQLFIPTAEMHEDRTLVIGAGFIPKGYFQRANRRINPGMPTFVTISLLPFVEVMFRYTHELNMRVNPQTKYYPDRTFAGRIRLLKESKYIPSLTIGAQDFLAKLGLASNANYASAYVVSTKSFSATKLVFKTTLGYGVDYINPSNLGQNFQGNQGTYINYDMLGIFGGVEMRYEKLPLSSVFLEYDSTHIHFSISHTFFDRVVLKAGLWDLKKPAAMIAYKYQIW